jgi:hypothetical protein
MEGSRHFWLGAFRHGRVSYLVEQGVSVLKGGIEYPGIEG